MDVKLPDGKIIRGVPEGTTKTQLAEKLQANGMTVPQEWLGKSEPTAQPAPEGYIQRRVEVVKSVFNPETYKSIAHELTNWPKSTPAIQKQLKEAAYGAALSTLPTTPIKSGFMGKLFQKTTTEPQIVTSLRKLQKEGFVVPPSEVKPTAVNTILESVGGKAATRQAASAKNAAVIDKLARNELNQSAVKAGVKPLEANSPLTSDVLEKMREEAGKAYEVAKSVGSMTPDKEYLSALDRIGKEYAGASKTFPELVKEDVKKLVTALNKPNIPSNEAVELVKRLRRDASSSFAARNADLGFAQRDAAEALDNLVERNIGIKGSPEAMSQYRGARKLIAQLHLTEDALNSTTGNISGQAFKKALDKNKHVTGGFKTIGQFVQGFPKAAQKPEVAGSANVNKLMALLGVAGGGIGYYRTHDPEKSLEYALPFIVAPMAARSILLSKPFQKSLTSGGLRDSKTIDAAQRMLAAYLAQNQNGQK